MQSCNLQSMSMPLIGCLTSSPIETPLPISTAAVFHLCLLSFFFFHPSEILAREYVPYHCPFLESDNYFLCQCFWALSFVVPASAFCYTFYVPLYESLWGYIMWVHWIIDVSWSLFSLILLLGDGCYRSAHVLKFSAIVFYKICLYRICCHILVSEQCSSMCRLHTANMQYSLWGLLSSKFINGRKADGNAFSWTRAILEISLTR